MYFLNLLTDFEDHIDIDLYSLTTILSEICFPFLSSISCCHAAAHQTHDVITSVAYMYSKRN
jgi:hypothetical protein